MPYVDTDLLKENFIKMLNEYDGVTVSLSKIAVSIGQVIAKTSAMQEKWINVKNELPKNNERVLVALSQDIAMTYTNIDTDRIENGKWVRWNKRVTHWMPLPELPEESEVGKDESSN